mgnify:CR=1 FL=1
MRIIRIFIRLYGIYYLAAQIKNVSRETFLIKWGQKRIKCFT